MQKIGGSKIFSFLFLSEMISGNKYTGREADIWSIGVILYALLCGYLPFDDDSNPRLYNLILNAKYEFPPFLSAGVFFLFSPFFPASQYVPNPPTLFFFFVVSSGSRDLISKLLRVNPTERLTLDKIKHHPWLSEPVPVPAHAKPKVSITAQRRNSTPLLTKINVRMNDSSESQFPLAKEKRFREIEDALDSPDVEEPRVPTPRTITPNLPEVSPNSPPRRRRKFSVPSEDELAHFVNLKLGQADSPLPSIQETHYVTTPILVSHKKEREEYLPSNPAQDQYEETLIFPSNANKTEDPLLKQYLQKGRRVCLPCLTRKENF